MTKIIGAGLAGLIAATTAFQDAIIYECQSKQGLKRHQVVLRFRSPKIGETLGIPFKKVMVNKSVYSDGKHHSACNIQHANEYSQKVVGALQSRSIWNLDTVDRWIAPEDFQDILLDRCKSRIVFDQKIESLGFHESVISTMPMPTMLKLVNTDERVNPLTKEKSKESAYPTSVEFKMKLIATIEFTIPGADVYQTIYFPDINCEFPDDVSPSSIYRASITGDKLTIEAVYGVMAIDSLNIVLEAFGLLSIKDQLRSQKSEWKVSSQGKISPIDEKWRRKFIFDLSNEHNIYSLGRFATWRQILLDDVLQDVYRIKNFINSDNYDRMVKS